MKAYEAQHQHPVQFEINAIRELGVTPFHRQDFGTVRVMLSAEQMALDMAGVAGLSPT